MTRIAEHDGGALDVAVVGAGPMGRAACAWLHAQGHRPVLWSPTARGEPVRIDCRGALSTSLQVPTLAVREALADFDTVIVCVPGNAYAAVLGPLRPVWRDGQTVIVSGALSLVGLWLAEAARARGTALRTVAWNTTLTTAHDLPDGTLHVNPRRDRIVLAALPASTTCDAQDLFADGAVELCERLFGPRFQDAGNLLAPTLANINPIAHAAEVIPNLTRMELGEDWPLFGCFSPAVARLAEVLDAERLATARAFGFALPTLREHYASSYRVPLAPLHEMAAEIERRGMGPRGPARLAHRYVLEDAPFGLAFQEALARRAGVPTPALSACLAVLETVYARDLRADNFLPGALGLLDADTTPSDLLSRCTASRNAATTPRPAPLAR